MGEKVEKASEIMENLDNVHNKLEQLKQERDKLLDANKKLMDIIGEFDQALQEEGIRKQEELGLQHYDYKDDLKMQKNIDIDRIRSEVSDVRETVRQLETFKNQENRN